MISSLPIAKEPSPIELFASAAMKIAPKEMLALKAALEQALKTDDEKLEEFLTVLRQEFPR